ncbi:MAG: YicC family protein [Kiritimatiellae bacterium]|nr:YicC family protein [Kiritimatiellia bacterium]
MAIKSMTGFGNDEASSTGVKIDVELSSVNRKQFDVRINLPRQMVSMDSRIRELVNKSVSRGFVTGIVKVSYAEGGKGSNVVVNMDLAEAYVKTLRKASKKLGLKDDLSARSLTYIPDLIRHENILEDSAKIWRVTKKALNAALQHLVEMRTTEGKMLEKDLLKRLKVMQSKLGSVKKIAPTVLERRLKLLRTRIKNAKIDLSGCSEMMAREMVLYADKCDVSEEVVRLDGHFAHMLKLMKSDKPVGRALDFLCQEMLREINTIGSKANDKAILENVIKLKTELECLREQVQNVE